MSMIIVITLVFVNPLYVFAKMQQISILNQTIDTQKPLVQQYEQAFERTKAAVTPAQYDRALQKLQFKWENATSSCSSMSVIFKGAQFQCDQIYSLVSTICNTPTAKSQMVLCVDPFVNEYLKSRNITGANIERFARYYLDSPPY
jgi:hypothetical protein